MAARTAQTAEASTIHKPFGSPSGPGLWHHKGLQLPAYIQSVAHHLVTQGHDESKAIEMAVGIVKNWAEGHDGHGHRVHPDVQAAAVKAVAQWEAGKAKSKVRRSAVTITRDAMATADINNLPDSDFGYIEPGGTKDASGRTVPRSLRHFPLNDADHIRNALSRAPQSPFGDKAMPKIRAAAKKAGIGEPASDSGSGSMSRFTLMRPYPLEECRILRASDGQEYASGRVVEGYATVFDYPVRIRDGQGHYEEVIDRTAFDQTLTRMRRSRGGLAGAVRVLYNHGKTMEGMPAPEFQRPLGKPLEVRPDGRGLLTRTEYNTTPLAEEILENIRAGSITAQSFEGPDIQSNPPLRGPGDKYRARNGVLPTVRRMVLGLLNYGPALFAANDGAEFLGVVRMSIPGFDEDPDLPEDEEYSPADEGDVAGGTPEEVHPSRSHAHRLWQMNTEDLCRQAGIVLKEK